MSQVESRRADASLGSAPPQKVGGKRQKFLDRVRGRGEGLTGCEVFPRSSIAGSRRGSLRVVSAASRVLRLSER